MSKRRRPRDLDWRELSTLVAIALVVWLFWYSWPVYPLKLLVVFFHELSHALAALVTGGGVERIELVPEQGGVCVTIGGSRFVTLTAGYLGSLAWGGLILIAAARTRRDREVTAALGVLLTLTALVWVRPLLGFGFLFAVATGLALIAAARYLSHAANDFLLKVVGLTSVLYAVLDIKSDVLDRPELLESDAAALARLTGLPTLFWGVVWFALALLAAAFFLVQACQRAGARR